MPEMNRVERRALLCGAVLVVLAAGVRVLTAPASGDVGWRPPPELGDGSVGWRSDLETAVAEAVSREERAQTPLDPGERIDPNGAPVEELRRLPGVGPARASAIVEARRAAPFRRPEDLQRVPGIGPATVARLTPHLSLDFGPRAPASGAGPVRSGLPALSAGASPRGVPPCDASRGGGRLDLNRADSAALVALPGIGPVRAGAIVRTRALIGGFPTVDRLTEVPGIGPRTLARLRLHLCID